MGVWRLAATAASRRTAVLSTPSPAFYLYRLRILSSGWSHNATGLPQSRLLSSTSTTDDNVLSTPSPVFFPYRLRILSSGWSHNATGLPQSRLLGSTATTDDNENNDEGQLLYLRSPNRLTFPRGLLVMTTLHTSYWMWYVLDFVPTINAASRAANEAKSGDAAAAFSGIDPTIGYLGLGMAIMMSLGSVAYPRHLVSEIRKGPTSQGVGSLRVGVHSLPFVTPGDMIVYHPAAVTIDSTADAEKIFTKHGGDLKKQRGFLALRAEGTRGNLLLNIGSDDEVKRGDLLLNYILPSGLKYGKVPIKGEGDGNSLASSGRKRRNVVDPRKKKREERLLRRRQ